jgi:DNA-binding SARP family transcriptional activator
MTANLENSDFTGGLQTEKPIQLKLLGAFSLKLPDGTELQLSSKKNRAILAILALSPNGQATRDRLCELLWGDRAEEQARSSLRQSLAVLRKELGAIETLILQSRDENINLNKAGVTIDVIQFAKHVSAANLDSLRLAAELYDGEILADTSLKDESFENWVGEQRRDLNERAIAMLEKLTELETGGARVTIAKRLLALDPLREA